MNYLWSLELALLQLLHIATMQTLLPQLCTHNARVLRYLSSRLRMALRLVNFYTRRDLSAIFRRDWHEFGIYQGRLVCDLFRGGITPTELRRLMFLAREVPSMRDIIRTQKNALAALSVECAKMRRDNAFFRDQARQENALRQWQGGGFC
jgi:hypothetical protein